VFGPTYILGLLCSYRSRSADCGIFSPPRPHAGRRSLAILHGSTAATFHKKCRPSARPISSPQLSSKRRTASSRSGATAGGRLRRRRSTGESRGGTSPSLPRRRRRREQAGLAVETTGCYLLVSCCNRTFLVPPRGFRGISAGL
jgi:hypothetical protein